MFLSSRNNQFRFEFPRKFIPQEISEKYKPIMNKMPGNLIEEPIDMLNYSIQAVNLPGISFEVTTQQDYPGYVRSHRSVEPTQNLFDKEMTVTFQSLDGFTNYWMCYDILKNYYARSGKDPFILEGVGIQFMDGEGNVFVIAQPKEMIMRSMTSLDLNFSSNTVEFNTFDIVFAYNILDIKLL